MPGKSAVHRWRTLNGVQLECSGAVQHLFYWSPFIRPDTASITSSSHPTNGEWPAQQREPSPHRGENWISSTAVYTTTTSEDQATTYGFTLPAR